MNNAPPWPPSQRWGALIAESAIRLSSTANISGCHFLSIGWFSERYSTQ